MESSIHADFMLDGCLYSVEELKSFANTLSQKIPSTYECHIGKFILSWLNSSDTIKVNTSGSTGVPKVIDISKKFMVNSALATGNFLDIKPTATALLCLPCNFIAGKMMLVRAMVLGLHLDYTEPSSSPLTKNTKSYDFSAMVPLQVNNSLDQIHQIKNLLIGGATINEELKMKLLKSDANIYETYGMTETVTHIALKKITDFKKDKIQSSENFKALPNVRLCLDERGCLNIDAPKVSKSLVITNDVVNLISETEFEWLGRYDNVVNSGGIKLIPEQIEAKLKKVLSGRFFMVGLPDNSLGQKLVLVFEGDEDKELLLHKITASNLLDKYEIPKEIICTTHLSETLNGKIQRQKTLERLFS